MKHTIDAQGKRLGRIATQVAVLLMGKKTVAFERNKKTDDRVVVVNAKGLSLSQKKRNQKKYKRYSGYPGGLKEESLRQVVAKKGYGEIVKKAVYGMLPANKTRAKLMKQLEIEE
ncbi:MAG: 50S ribosomal protein L13 [Candidatus Paceibacterota bacterium]